MWLNDFALCLRFVFPLPPSDLKWSSFRGLVLHNTTSFFLLFLDCFHLSIVLDGYTYTVGWINFGPIKKLESVEDKFKKYLQKSDVMHSNGSEICEF